MDNPDAVVIPEGKTLHTILNDLLYYTVDQLAKSSSEPPLFGGHQSWKQREESF